MSGRSHLALIAFLAAAVVAGLFASGVISFDSGSTAEDEAARDAALLEGSEELTEGTEETRGAGLATLYGEGDLGALQMRLLWVSGGQPVVDQPVTLHGRAGVKIAEATSGADGEVMFAEVLPAARFSLRIEGDGFATVQIRNVHIDSKRTTDLGDIMLGERIVLRGRVISTSGKPLPGSSVSVHEVKRNMMSQGFMFSMAAEATSVPIPLDDVTSDDDGYFTFATLADGTYRLVARQGGYAAKHETDVMVNESRSANVLTIVLGEGTRVYGTVKNDEGKAIAGAQVVAFRDYGRRFNMRNAFEREVGLTDENGKYEIDTLQLGAQYRFGVIAEGYPTMYEARGTQVGDAGLKRDFVLQEGGAITGMVVSSVDATPVAGAQVAAMLGQMGRGQGSAQLAETDEDGRFTFPSLLPGPVMSLSVKAKGFITHSKSMWTGNQLPKIEPGDEQNVVVELEPGGTIEGQVKDDSGTPLIGAMVSVMSGNMGMMFTGAPTASTIEDGSFTLTGLPKGSYTLTAQADGFASTEGEKAVEVPEGGTPTICDSPRPGARPVS